MPSETLKTGSEPTASLSKIEDFLSIPSDKGPEIDSGTISPQVKIDTSEPIVSRPVAPLEDIENFLGIPEKKDELSAPSVEAVKPQPKLTEKLELPKRESIGMPKLPEAVAVAVVSTKDPVGRLLRQARKITFKISPNVTLPQAIGINIVNGLKIVGGWEERKRIQIREQLADERNVTGLNGPLKQDAEASILRTLEEAAKVDKSGVTSRSSADYLKPEEKILGNKQAVTDIINVVEKAILESVKGKGEKYAQEQFDNEMIDLLVENGIITQSEAQYYKADYITDLATKVILPHIDYLKKVDKHEEAMQRLRDHLEKTIVLGKMKAAGDTRVTDEGSYKSKLINDLGEKITESTNGLANPKSAAVIASAAVIVGMGSVRSLPKVIPVVGTFFSALGVSAWFGRKEGEHGAILNIGTMEEEAAAGKDIERVRTNRNVEAHEVELVNKYPSEYIREQLENIKDVFMNGDRKLDNGSTLTRKEAIFLLSHWGEMVKVMNSSGKSFILPNGRDLDISEIRVGQEIRDMISNLKGNLTTSEYADYIAQMGMNKSFSAEITRVNTKNKAYIEQEALASAKRAGIAALILGGGLTTLLNVDGAILGAIGHVKDNIFHHVQVGTTPPIHETFATGTPGTTDVPLHTNTPTPHIELQTPTPESHVLTGIQNIIDEQNKEAGNNIHLLHNDLNVHQITGANEQGIQILHEVNPVKGEGWYFDMKDNINVNGQLLSNSIDAHNSFILVDGTDHGQTFQALIPMEAVKDAQGNIVGAMANFDPNSPIAHNWFDSAGHFKGGSVSVLLKGDGDIYNRLASYGGLGQNMDSTFTVVSESPVTTAFNNVDLTKNIVDQLPQSGLADYDLSKISEVSGTLTVQNLHEAINNTTPTLDALYSFGELGRNFVSDLSNISVEFVPIVGTPIVAEAVEHTIPRPTLTSAKPLPREAAPEPIVAPKTLTEEEKRLNKIDENLKQGAGVTEDFWNKVNEAGREFEEHKTAMDELGKGRIARMEKRMGKTFEMMKQQEDRERMRTMRGKIEELLGKDFDYNRDDLKTVELYYATALQPLSRLLLESEVDQAKVLVETGLIDLYNFSPQIEREFKLSYLNWQTKSPESVEENVKAFLTSVKEYTLSNSYNIINSDETQESTLREALKSYIGIRIDSTEYSVTLETLTPEELYRGDRENPDILSVVKSLTPFESLTIVQNKLEEYKIKYAQLTVSLEQEISSNDYSEPGNSRRLAAVLGDTSNTIPEWFVPSEYQLGTIRRILNRPNNLVVAAREANSLFSKYAQDAQLEITEQLKEFITNKPLDDIGRREGIKRILSLYYGEYSPITVGVNELNPGRIERATNSILGNPYLDSIYKIRLLRDTVNSRLRAIEKLDKQLEEDVKNMNNSEDTISILERSGDFDNYNVNTADYEDLNDTDKASIVDLLKDETLPVHWRAVAARGVYADSLESKTKGLRELNTIILRNRDLLLQDQPDINVMEEILNSEEYYNFGKVNAEALSKLSANKKRELADILLAENIGYKEKITNSVELVNRYNEIYKEYTEDDKIGKVLTDRSLTKSERLQAIINMVSEDILTEDTLYVANMPDEIVSKRIKELTQVLPANRLRIALRVRELLSKDTTTVVTRKSEVPVDEELNMRKSIENELNEAIEEQSDTRAYRKIVHVVNKIRKDRNLAEFPNKVDSKLKTRILSVLRDEVDQRASYDRLEDIMGILEQGRN